MEKTDAIPALAALAQENRLDVFRLLVRAGTQGVSAGVLAEQLGVSPSNLTFHLDRLRHAGLVSVKREGRSKIYAARFATMYGLLSYLSENCCAGLPPPPDKPAAKPRSSSRSKKDVSE